MFEDWLRKKSAGPLDRIAAAIGTTGLSPNALSLAGFLITLGAAGLITTGHFVAGGVVVAIAGLFDALDGALARSTGRISRFGAFLDSFTDRYSEIVLFFALFLFYLSGGEGALSLALIYLAITGSLMVSYARARAEGLQLESRGGITTRSERVALLVLGLLSGYILPVLAVLAVLTHLTALQRMYDVYRQNHG